MARLAFLLALASVSFAPTARAATDPATARAKALFDHAEALYALTRYDEALAEYEKAFEARALPGLLFNIGQCHRQLHHWEKAAYFYRTYLERQPGARNRALVESLIAEMDQHQRAESAAAASPATAPPPVRAPAAATAPSVASAPVPAGADLARPIAVAPRSSRAPLYRRWWVWAGAGAAVVVAGAIGLGVGLGESGPGAAPQGTLSTVDAR